MATKYKMLNLGCGKRYHEDWTNIDFLKTGKDVISHNLLKGIPFKDEEFEVIYHSHVLEHFSREDANYFIQECYRVLKPGGVIRIAVPDLERIIKHYLEIMEKALEGDEQAIDDYEWIMLELYDQAIRNKSGGSMASYLKRKIIPNKDFVYQRLGQEAKNIHEIFLQQGKISSFKFKNIAKRVIKWLCEKLVIFRRYQIGKFRLGGEIHQWMYDRYSLSKLLQNCGFDNPRVTNAFESQIPNWEQYQFLDTEDGEVRKPDSLFIEANKI